MGVATALALTAAAASAYGGYQAQQEAKKQSGMAIEQSQMAARETERQTARQVELEERDIERTTERQRIAYLASGVTLEGSPLLKLEETRRLGAENIEEIQKAGEATSKAQETEGRVLANRARASGRQALLSGFSGAARTGAGVF